MASEPDDEKRLSRSEQNGNNSRKHGYSQHDLYEVYRGIVRRGDPLSAAWAHPKTGLARFISDIYDTIGPRPSKEYELRPRSLVDRQYRRGNVVWMPKERRPTARQLRAIERRIKRDGLVQGDLNAVSCDCWLRYPANECHVPDCMCDWERRIECRCCVGIRTRLGMFDDDVDAEGSS